MLDQGIEVVFFGSDTGAETVRDIKMPQHFARSMSVADAMDPHNLLCYEMNGEPLPQMHGFPVRLIAPGWYGIANVKWLQRIEVLADALRGPLHGARLRDHPRAAGRRPDGVDRDIRRSGAAQVGAGQGHPHRTASIGSWAPPGVRRSRRSRCRSTAGRGMPATHRRGRGRRVRLEAVVAGVGEPGGGRAHHHLAGHRRDGHVQPAQDDPWIASKHTYWESNGQITRRVRIA